MHEYRLSIELRLAALCCLAGFAPGNPEEVRRAAGAVDWDRFLQLVRRNRVEPLVRKGLRETGLVVPPEVSATLDASAERAVRQNLVLAAASEDLLLRMRRADIDPLFVKGLTLGKLVYGNIALKEGWDIDLLVGKHQAPSAYAVLRDLGYICIQPALGSDDDRLRIWAQTSKESLWQHRTTGVYVELHTRLVDNPMLLPGLDETAPRQLVEVADEIILPTLREELLFAYLCVHGASSAWFRLKWSADLAALLAGKSAHDVEQLYAASQLLGAGRAAAQALLLANVLFGTAIPGPLLSDLMSSWVNCRLLGIALRLLDADTELRHRLLGTVPIHMAQFLLLPGWAFKRSELRRQLGSVWSNTTR